MLLRLIEEKKQIDEVVFFDTGMEFGCIYTIMRRVMKLLEKENIPFTRLKAPETFLYMMLHRLVHHRDGSEGCGYKWCGGVCRWYTAEKTRTIKNYLKDKYPDGFMEYVGIAADEPQRIERNSGKLLPLVRWGMSETDCLMYCHDRGFYWYEGEYELYDHLKRVSCWCCRNKNLTELKEIYIHFKPYWLALCELENRCGMNMKNKSLKDLEDKWRGEGIE